MGLFINCTRKDTAEQEREVKAKVTPPERGLEESGKDNGGGFQGL